MEHKEEWKIEKQKDKDLIWVEDKEEEDNKARRKIVASQRDLTKSRKDICKTREKFNFSEKGKTVISVENQKFSKSRMRKLTAPLNSSRKI